MGSNGQIIVVRLRTHTFAEYCNLTDVHFYIFSLIHQVPFSFESFHIL